MTGSLKRVFIGHRGVGKSSLLKRHQSYFPKVVHFDLDQEIEKKINQGISEFFKQQGEKKFREVEKNVFAQLIQAENYVISLGAGFDISLIPNDCEVIYVSRRTDSDGRIFLNRPRLNPELSALNEYHQRFVQREPKFRLRADFVYHLPEGLREDHKIASNIEKSIFEFSLNSDFKIQNGFVTLIPTKESLLRYFDSVELRTDLFLDQEIARITNQYSKKSFLISYRQQPSSLAHITGQVDWALELGEVPSVLFKNEQLIVSNHDDPIRKAIEKFKNYSTFQQKLCPVVTNWHELIEGHQWQQADPAKRSFLPRSPKNAPKSLWRWYRELQFLKQKINFIQMLQDFDDQPSLFEYLKSITFQKEHDFFAVLGDPVHHSWTPLTQMQTMKKNVLAIPLQEADFFTAVNFLKDLDLQAAAITSPLKKLAGELANKTHPCNTLVFHQDSVAGTSTDETGFQKLLESFEKQSHLNLKDQKVVVWGGGGVLDSLKDQLPQASFYSAQTAMPRAGQSAVEAPDVLIWSAPRKGGIQMPPPSWKPTWVIDVNYAENSLGIEYAQMTGAHYISGADMFYAQAEAQVTFWKKFFK